MSELAKRVGVAVVAIPAVLAATWVGGWTLAAVVGAVAAIAAGEFVALSNAAGTPALKVHTILIAAAMPVAAVAVLEGFPVPPLGVAVLLVLELMVVALWVRGGSQNALGSVGATLLGILYVGGMLSYAIALRHHRFALDARAGTLLVALPLVVTWVTDSAAMFAGKAWGVRKLWPAVSPGKTVVGAVAGLIAAVLVSVAAARFALPPLARIGMTTGAAVGFGLIVSAVGQVGDLAESLFKRQAGVKDSSRLIPGHGGVLDRVDSLLFALPVAYVLYDFVLVVTP
ncbi:MAG: phosphatidate cytidylyltransferase [Gemmatimonadetes bacterium]|nr:phosphatidate cytidylyltransferase [Gemmatimonadota bacterium]